MPPEHEIVFGAVAVAYYFLKQVDEQTIQKHPGVLTKLFNMMNDTLESVDTNKVSMRLRWTAETLRDVAARELSFYAANNRITHLTLPRLREMCRMGLAQPKLQVMPPKTWEEQIAGRANLAARQLWPELRDNKYR